MAILRSKYPQLVNPVYIGDKPASEMELSILTYGGSSDSVSPSSEFKKVSSIEELIRLKNQSTMSWINISGFNNADSIKRLCESLEIHPLTIEDILHTEQQAKIEVFDEYRFFSMKSIQQEKNIFGSKFAKKMRRVKKSDVSDDLNNELIIDQISMIITKNTLLTFQEISGDSFGSIRKKLLESSDGAGIHKLDTDYLAYLIIDTIVDEYSVAISHLEEYIENLEERATETKDNTFIEEIQDTKKYLLQIKRAILPLKDNLLIVSRHDSFFRIEGIKPFFHDLNENLNHAVTLAEHYREWLSNIMEVNLSILSHQTNRVMKVLAMISTIFIPLTFIAGIYGMNFEFMPELGYELAYPIVLCGMCLTAIVMIIVFKIHRWF